MINHLPSADNYSIVALVLLFNSVELKIVWDVVIKRTGRFKVTNELQENRVLLAIVKVLDYSNEFNTYAQMVESLSLGQVHKHLAFNIFSILEDDGFVWALVAIFDSSSFAALWLR